jgi:hypothetical protein
MVPLPLSTLFVLNGIGYLALVVALYFLVVGLRPYLVGIVDKVVEVALIILLLIEDRQRLT